MTKSERIFRRTVTGFETRNALRSATFPALINADCFQADTAAVFKNFAAGDFRLTANSPAANKGLRLDWMEGATDLAGKPRLVSKPDIGCYECQSGAQMCLILR